VFVAMNSATFVGLSGKYLIGISNLDLTHCSFAWAILPSRLGNNAIALSGTRIGLSVPQTSEYEHKATSQQHLISSKRA
jgi:hypothetical protein